MSMYKIAIIGSGISGLSIANILKQRRIQTTVYEKANQPGGLIKCEKIDGVLFHKVGGHVFNSKNEKVLKWFWDFFDKSNEFILTKRNAKILFNGKNIGYPIENNIFQLPQELIEDIVNDIVQLLHINKRNNIYTNFEHFLRENFGKTLFEIYFSPYNRKIWNTDLKKIPLEWLDGKLPMPDYKEIILNNFTRKEESKMVHSAFFYPKENGSQFIADKLSNGLNIKYNSAVHNLEYTKDNNWKINNQNEYDAIIYTGDIRSLPKLIQNNIIPDSVSESLKSLKSNGTSNVLCKIDPNDISWLYLPEKNILPHRIIYTGNFSSKNNGEIHKNTCTIEFSGIYSEEIMCAEIKKLPGNPIPLAFNQEENSYIIHNHNTTTLVDQVKENLIDKRFYLLGRFAEWQYYNMDKAIEAAMELADQMFPIKS